MFFGNAPRCYISYIKQKAVTYQHQIHTDLRNSCMSVPLNTTRNKECSLRSLEIRYPAYWLFWYSSSAPQRSMTAPGAHAHINTVTCFVHTECIPYRSTHTAAVTPSPFFRWKLTFSNRGSEGTHPPMLPFSQSAGILHFWSYGGNEGQRSVWMLSMKRNSK